VGVDVSLGRANVAIRATMDHLDGDLNQARGRVDGAVRQMTHGASEAFQGLGRAALGGIGIASGAVAGLAGTLAAITIAAAPIQNLQDAFAGLAESAGIGMDDMLAALQRSSSGMIANRDLMLSFNRAAQLVSVDFATQLPEAMQYLSRVSASTGLDMKYLLDSLTLGVGRLSPKILDNLAIQVSLADATEAAAMMYGVEADELSNVQIQAGMMSVVLDRLAKNTAAMPDITQTAAARLAQMRTTFQNLKDTIGMAFLPVLNTLLTTVGNLAERFLPPLVDFLESSVVPVFDTVAFAIDSFVAAIMSGQSPIDALTGVLRDIGLDSLADRIDAVVAAITPFIEQMTTLLTPVGEWIRENVSLQDVLLVLGAAIATVVLPALWSVITTVAPVVAVFLLAVGAVAALRTAWENDFLGIRTAIIEAWEGVILPALQQLWEWLQVNVPIAIQTLSDFWTNTLLPAIRQVWEWVQSTLLPILADLWNWLQENVPAAIRTLSDFWTNILWPAIQAVVGFFQNSVMPVLAEVASVASAVLGAAIETVSAIWESILLPAIQIVWGFFQDSIIPVMQAVAEVAGAILGKAVEALAGLWQNVLWPALEAVWDVIKANVLPIFREIADFVRQNIGPAFEQLAERVLPPIRVAFEGISGAISDVVGWLRDLASNIGSIELPDWLTPGSPTPFELGLRGIGDAMRRLTQMQIPQLSSELRQVYEVEAVTRPDNGGGGRRQQVVIYGLTLEGVQDRQGLLAELQALI